MGSKFIVLAAVLATMAQISLAGPPPNNSKTSVDVDSTIPEDKNRPVATCNPKEVTDAERGGVVGAKQAVAMVYITMKVKISEATKRSKNKRTDGNSTTDCEAPNGNIFADVIENYFIGIRAADPDADPIISKARLMVNSAADKVVAGIGDAIALIGKKYSPQVLSEWEKEKNIVINGVLAATKYVYEAVMNDRKPCSPLGARIMKAHAITNLLVIKGFGAVLEVIKQAVLQVSRHHNSKGSDCSLSLDYYAAKSYNDFQAIVESIFDAIGDVLQACCGQPNHIYKHL